jgi:hypothetical protein|tara:strand:+ start:222 stop:1397 length:1176 start_codon:yes stop_codon:yes gene_type:complete
MSNLLSEAIIDAKALKEAALKNAEAAVIEKYSTEVKQTLDNLLEQEEEMLADPLAGLEDPAADPAADLGGAEEDPMAAAGEEEIPDLAPEVPLAAGDGIGEDPRKEGSPVEFNVDLQALQEAVAELEGELDEEEDIEINEIDLAALFEDDEIEITEEESSDTPDPEADVDYTAGVDDEKGDPVGGEAAAETADSIAMKNAGLEESTEALVDAIMEKLTVDMGADLSGWAGRSSEDMKFEIEKEMAHRRSTDVAEDLETLKKAQEELVFENSQLNEKLLNYKQAVGELKENLYEVNLSNGRLLYTNRILRNTSLNERQKTKIVEAISNAGSVAEARTIFDTLQSTVESTPKRAPQSLGEVINRRSSVIRASRHESTSSDPISDRMKKLAGIK